MTFLSFKNIFDSQPSSGGSHTFNPNTWPPLSTKLHRVHLVLNCYLLLPPFSSPTLLFFFLSFFPSLSSILIFIFHFTFFLLRTVLIHILKVIHCDPFLLDIYSLVIYVFIILLINMSIYKHY